MASWKIIILSVLGFVVLGCIAGVFIGKQQLKAMQGRKSLLSRKEKILYSASILAGIIMILIGALVPIPGQNSPDNLEIEGGGEMYGDPNMTMPFADGELAEAVDGEEDSAQEKSLPEGDQETTADENLSENAQESEEFTEADSSDDDAASGTEQS